MTTDFIFHKEHMGKVQAIRHTMLMNGEFPNYKLAPALRHTVMPDGKIIKRIIK